MNLTKNILDNIIDEIIEENKNSVPKESVIKTEFKIQKLLDQIEEMEKSNIRRN